MKLASNKNKSFWPYSNNKCINIFQWKKSFVFSKKKWRNFFFQRMACICLKRIINLIWKGNFKTYIQIYCLCPHGYVTVPSSIIHILSLLPVIIQFQASLEQELSKNKEKLNEFLSLCREILIRFVDQYFPTAVEGAVSTCCEFRSLVILDRS